MTLYSAFFTTLMDRPAEMFSMEAPSFWACLTRGIHEHRAAAAQVHRACRQRGPAWQTPARCSPAPRQRSAKSCRSRRSRPRSGRCCSMAPFSILKHLMSCPPMSMTKSTSGMKCLAAVKWATVSTTPKSTPKALFTMLLAVAGGGGAGRSAGPGAPRKCPCRNCRMMGHRVAAVGLIAGDKQMVSSESMTTAFTVVEPASMPMCTGAGAVRKGTRVGTRRLCVPLRGTPRIPLGRGTAAALNGIGGRGAVVRAAWPITPARSSSSVGVQRRAQRHIIQGCFPGRCPVTPRVLSKLARSWDKNVSGPAQIQHVAARSPGPAQGRRWSGSPRRRKCWRRHRPSFGALVDKGLDIAFGKHAAAAGDGVGFFRMLCAASFISSGVIFSRVAIWSMNAPVPPAQVPFMRTSVPPVKNRIFASSPPSSMTTSASGRVTLCRHPGGKHLLYEGHAAGVGQAHAGRTGDGKLRAARRAAPQSCMRCSSSAAFSTMWEK